MIWREIRLTVRSARRRDYVQRVTTRRCDIVDADSPGTYHCISRCVRRTSLLDDPKRRAWIVSRLAFLSEFMAIDVVSFAIMRNHIHLLLTTRPEIVARWTDREVAMRRTALLPNQRWRKKHGVPRDAEPSETEIESMLLDRPRLSRARRELSTLGLFHRLLKEPCARAWNREEHVTGHFWEGRFKSPKVLDMQGLLQVAQYVELNEVHACVASSISSSQWTSASRQWRRLYNLVEKMLQSTDRGPEELARKISRFAWEPAFPCRISPLTEFQQVQTPRGTTERKVSAGLATGCEIPSLASYLALLDRNGRRQRPDKPGWIPRWEPDPLRVLFDGILNNLGVDQRPNPIRVRSLEAQLRRVTVPSISTAKNFPSSRGSCYGSEESMRREACRRGRRWLWRGIRSHVAA